MPTDLPEFFSGTDPLGDVKANMKAQRKLARKAVGQSLWAIAKSLMLHYVISLAGVAVIAAAGFSSVPRAAVSATALGLLARWFLPNRARAQADAQLRQPKPEFEVMELTPDQLQEFFGNLGNPDAHQGATPEGVAKPTPYL